MGQVVDPVDGVAVGQDFEGGVEAALNQVGHRLVGVVGHVRGVDHPVVGQQAGEERIVTERTQVQLFDNGDGTYTARLSEDSSYYAIVTADMVDNDGSEAIRIALIVILTVLALLIIGVYIFLLPREKYRKRR